MKKFHYVYTVVNAWRNLLNNFYSHNQASGDDTDLYQVFNRDFTNAFLMGNLNKDVFTDNPRDHSAHYFHEAKRRSTDEGIGLTKTELQDIRAEIITKAKSKIAALDVEKTPFVLNGSKEDIDPIETPRLEKQNKLKIKPHLSVLISSRAQLEQCRQTSVDLFFQLPSCFPDESSVLVELLLENRVLTPWFPSVLIGKDYTAAVDILDQVKPKQIVTNNTGIAYEAYKKGIPWIAGPYLNIVNSFSLLCLKEKFNCSGSFISNEISRDQIMKIITPKDFELYYSIYHPVLLLTSRQCLLHPIEGCVKSIVDDECKLDCNRSSSITNLKDVALFVDKSKGCYHRIYNNHHFLNADIVTDLPDRFSSFFIDLTDVKTETQVEMSEIHIIKIFEDFLNEKPGSKEELEKAIHPSSNIQYKRGI
jgi:putative protease